MNVRLLRRLKRLVLGVSLFTGLCLLTLITLDAKYPFPIERLEQWPSSPQVFDRQGELLWTSVGPDDQWRFPVTLDEVSPWLIEATIAVEDERFREHLGVDVLAVGRAMAQNLFAMDVVSGASTLTMQIAKMTDPRSRTMKAKVIESLRALQLERMETKDRLLELYLDIAPYGGNIRGVGAASLFYFGKRPSDLSLGEAAILAGIPQAPSRYVEGSFVKTAKARRVTVLHRLHELGRITESQRDRALAEKIVLRKRGRSRRAPHLAWWAMSRRPLGGRTTIDGHLQSQVERLGREHGDLLAPEADLAVVVLHIETGEVRAMVGSKDPYDPRDGQVNGALARRSPGSTLKPFLYAVGFEANRLSPQSIVHDIPIQRQGWRPRNFDGTTHGAVSVETALRRSLNVPAILVTEALGLDRCLSTLERLGFDLPDDSRRRSGLALAVGATEVTLLDLTNAYATIGRGGKHRGVSLFVDEPSNDYRGDTRVFREEVCQALDNILSNRQRTASEGPREVRVSRGAIPELTSPSEAPLQGPWFMWKTGTSSARRDAWAVGHNRRYAVGVWVGCFSGAGRFDFVGREVAEPLMAEIFRLPGVREDRTPSPARTWEIHRPLPPPRELSTTLRIENPESGAVYRAMAGATTLAPRANRDRDLEWFLDGRPLSREQTRRLELGPGSYELRCVEPSGENASSRFEVR